MAELGLVQLEHLPAKNFKRITGVEQGFPFVSREYFVEILFMGGALARLENARDPIGVEVDQNLRAWALKKLGDN